MPPMIGRRARHQRFKGLSINRMIPNMLTLLALCAGMTSIRYAIQDRWEAAVAAMCIAAVLDALDGRIARLLKGASRFGAELDSLSDFLCFGAAPAIIVYLWSLQSFGTLGWIPCLLYAICVALRLARFNVALDEPVLPPWAFNFFSGVPSPAGAGLAVLPMMFAFWFDEAEGIARHPLMTGAILLIVAGLMVSRLPTFSLKKFKVPNVWILPMMLILGLVAAGIIVEPWKTLSMLGLVYVVVLPFGFLSYRRLERMATALQEKGGPAPEGNGTAP